MPDGSDAPAGLKAQQRRYYDDEITDLEFETARPRGAGRFYCYLMRFKVARSLALLPHDIAGSTILDLCAGSGMDAEILHRQGASVVCVDISEGALARARRRSEWFGGSDRLVAGDAEELPFLGGSFDYAFVHDGLHHLADPEAALREMARVSRRGVVVTEPADAAVTKMAIQLRLLPATEEAGNEVRRLRAEDLDALLMSLGFEHTRHCRYLVKYHHRPGPFARLCDLPGLFSISRFLVESVGGRLLASWGNKLAFAAWRDERALRAK